MTIALAGKVNGDGSAQALPDITINISGNKGGCTPVRITSLKPIMFQPSCKPYCDDYWWGYKVYLTVGDAAAACGCGMHVLLCVWRLCRCSSTQLRS